MLFGLVALMVGSASGTPPSEEEFSRALQLYESHRYSEARERFDLLANNRLRDPEIHFYRGRLALWFDDARSALALLEDAVRTSPDDPRFHNALGDAYGLMAQTAPLLLKLSWAKKCLASYERAVALAPRTVDYRWSLLGYYCVAPAIAGGGKQKAFAQAAIIRSLDPASGRIAYATVFLAEKRPADAFLEFDSFLKENPDDFLALYQLGRCAALSGEELDRGAAALRRCLAIQPPNGNGMPSHAHVRHRLGNILEKRGDPDGARIEYAAAMALEPDFRPEKSALKN
jgi:tetratricopeptide (TPR) repeat protein